MGSAKDSALHKIDNWIGRWLTCPRGDQVKIRDVFYILSLKASTSELQEHFTLLVCVSTQKMHTISHFLSYHEHLNLWKPLQKYSWINTMTQKRQVKQLHRTESIQCFELFQHSIKSTHQRLHFKAVPEFDTYPSNCKKALLLILIYVF